MKNFLFMSCNPPPDHLLVVDDSPDNVFQTILEEEG